MNKEKQIEEMADEQIGEMSAIIYTGGVLGKTSVDIAKILYAKCYRKQSEVGKLRVEIDTESFENKALQAERGWYRKKFYCPNCELLIKTESWDSKYMFGSGTVLKSGEMPNFCPKCGAKMKGGAEYERSI